MKKWIVVFLLQTSIAFGGGSITIEQGESSITIEQGTGSILMSREYDPPMNFVYTNSSTGTLTASWDHSPAPPISDYTFRVSTAGDMTGTVTSSTTISNSALLGETPLSINTTYYGQVRTNYQDGNSSPYTLNVATSTRANAPLTETSTWTFVGGSSLAFQWSNNSNPLNVTQYVAELSTASDFTGLLNSATVYTLTSTHTNLSGNTTYYGRVKAVNHSQIATSFLTVGSTTTDITMNLIQSTCSVPGFNDPGTLTFSNSVVVGNTVVVLAVTSGENLNTNSATDNKGNVYAQRSIASGSSSESAIFVATAVATGGSSFAVTVDANGTGGAVNFCAAEFSGVTLYDQQNSSTSVGTAVTSNSITTTGAAIWLGVMVHETGSPTITEDGAWSLIGEYEPNTFMSYSAIYRIGTTGETDSADWTLGGSSTWRANVVTLD